MPPKYHERTEKPARPRFKQQALLWKGNCNTQGRKTSGAAASVTAASGARTLVASSVHTWGPPLPLWTLQGFSHGFCGTPGQFLVRGRRTEIT